MSRPERWWRPTVQRPGARPPVRSSRRARYAAQEKYMEGFDLGMKVGEAEERRRHRERDEHLNRLARAADAAQNGDSSLLDELTRQAAVDDMLADVDGGQLVDELQQWLAEQDGDA
ncbi:hypothetical protein JNW91_24105 [Micromonospora sp. STR1_7]|uniref:Uncharacterized protein n=1 Tax=Micromonospora parastrephiae TaxID=2806101 RepID=A0ABS1XZE5_9ACTN|nr:hypothetical protein [Micromonospora parastrephiae]MBM0234636.1 hypothetical protein [Micromonospora parastrephiae]